MTRRSNEWSDAREANSEVCAAVPLGKKRVPFHAEKSSYFFLIPTGTAAFISPLASTSSLWILISSLFFYIIFYSFLFSSLCNCDFRSLTHSCPGWPLELETITSTHPTRTAWDRSSRLVSYSWFRASSILMTSMYVMLLLILHSLDLFRTAFLV